MTTTTESRNDKKSSASKRRGLPSKVRMRHSHHFVEELAARSEQSVGRLIAISSIEPDPKQPRGNMGDLSELTESIKAKGVLEPILVRKLERQDVDPGEGASSESGPRVEEGAAAYRIISGERRYRSAMAAGLIEIPAIEMSVTEDEALEIALIENLQRKDLTPFEEAEGYRRLAEAFEYTHERISESVGKSRVSVTESLALLQMPARVRDVVEALGIRSKSILLEVMKLDDEDEMIRLLEKTQTLGLNRADLRQEVKRARGNPARKPKKPYTFSFKAPDKRFSLSLRFRQSTVDHDDLIGALEEILNELRGLEEADRRRILSP